MTHCGSASGCGRRVTYRGRLRFPYGFHSGDGRRLDLADQPLFREPDGRIALAGSSLAGALRADLRKLVGAACTGRRDCACPLCRLMGPEPPEQRGPEREDKSLLASRLYVSGGCCNRPPDVRIRDHVGIDRRTRTAADRRKYDVEVAEAGLELPFELRIDTADEQEVWYLEVALRRLAGGWWFLGGKTASGLGRVELAELVRHEVDLAEPEALVEYLLADEPGAIGRSMSLVSRAGDGTWASEGPMPEGSQEARDWAQLRLHLELEFPWGVLVNAPAEALLTGTDHAFSRLPDGRPFLPGSSLRGALRSRAEQILRTLGGEEAACDLNRRDHACHERIKKLENESKQPFSFEEDLDRHCAACRVFGSGRLASGVKLTDLHAVERGLSGLAQAEGGGPRGAAERARGRQATVQEFVAIDRFTGGAAEGAKFDAQLSAPVTLCGEIHLELSPDRLRPWGLGLVALVLRDLLAGDVPLGFGSGKGLNEYRARIAGVDRFWLQPPEALAGLGVDDRPGTRCWPADGEPDWADPQAVRQLLGEPLTARLARWVEVLREEVTGPEADPSENASTPSGDRAEGAAPGPGEAEPGENGTAGGGGGAKEESR